MKFIFYNKTVYILADIPYVSGRQKLLHFAQIPRNALPPVLIFEKEAVFVCCLS